MAGSSSNHNVIITIKGESSNVVSALKKSKLSAEDFNRALAAVSGGALKASKDGKTLRNTLGQFVSPAVAAKGASQGLASALVQQANAAEDATQAQRQLSDVTGTASFAVVSLGQGFQDAGQFGMGMAQGVRAVTNNVQQAAQAFILLRQKTDSAKGAFIAFKTAMTGPVGFLLAFSAITAAIEGISSKMQMMKSDTEKAGQAFSEFIAINTDEFETFTATLDQIVDIIDELKQRKLDIVQALLGAEFRGPGKEAQRIILAERLVELETQLGIRAGQRDELIEKTQVRRWDIVTAAERLLMLDEQNNQLLEDLAEDKDLARKLREAEALAREEKKEADRLEKIRIAEIVAAAERAAELDAARIRDAEDLRLVGEQIVDWKQEELDITEEILEDIEEIESAQQSITREIILQVEALRVAASRDVELPPDDFSRLLKPIKTTFDEIEQATIRFERAMTMQFASGVTSFVEGIGEMVTAGGGAGKLIIPLANMAINMGRIAIAAGLTIEAIKDSLGSFIGIPSIVAGVALIAVGSAVKGAIKAQGNSLSGGGSHTARIRSLGPSSFGHVPHVSKKVFSPALAGGGTLQQQFVIKGQDLVTVSDTARASNVRVIGQ